ncbi:MAG: tetratricopeptide repeat protein, partial [Terriglobia bacterium]
YRYVSLSFGVGRFQPHPAAEVFANGYGDCKDKHTLFASLLRAVGLKAYPVLIHSQRTLDAEVPSPSQFDHLITAIPVGDELVWLDTTAEVAPFGLLASVLRDKQALVIADSSEPHLVETPAQLPFPQLQMLEVEGKVNALGKLEAQVQQTYRGDVELAARAAFRRVPRNRWDRLGQLLAYSTGYGGEASEVTASDPSDTAEPFEFGYHYTRDDYIDWKRRRGEMNLPLPAMNLPTFDEEAEEPPEAIELGSPGEYIHRARVQIPVRTKATPPLEVSLSRDYADYEAHYKMEEDILVLERRLRVRESEVPASRRSDYMAFYRVIKQDQEQDVILQRESEDLASTLEDVEPEELLQAALKALDANDYETATGYLEKLVEAEPEHSEAWSTLGLTYLNQMRVDEAIEAFQRQLEIDPYEETANGSLSLSLALKGDYEGAEAAAKKQLEINPFDLGTRRLLAQIYVETKRYEEAVPLLETAAVQRPDDLGLKAGLGQAYLGSGAEEKALALFEEAIELNPSPVVRNNVAYVLATMDAHLGQAQTWAETAVEETAEQLRQANLEDPSQETLQSVSLLVAAWDTLGYVYLKKGRLDKAESYLSAAWVTEQNAEIAEHLLAVYEKQDKGKEAAALRKLIKSAPKQAQAFAGFFQGLLGPRGEAAVGSQLKPSEELQQMRTVKLDRKRKVTENAEFYVLLAPGPRVEDARFISGSESLKEWTETLKAAQFPVEFPDHTPTKLVRRGILSCSEHNGECMFVLYEPDRALVMAVTDELSE